MQFSFIAFLHNLATSIRLGSLSICPSLLDGKWHTINWIVSNDDVDKSFTHRISRVLSEVSSLNTGVYFLKLRSLSFCLLNSKATSAPLSSRESMWTISYFEELMAFDKSNKTDLFSISQTPNTSGEDLPSKSESTLLNFISF